MALNFTEEEVTSGSDGHKALKLNELEIGESVTFFVIDKRSRVSEEYGEFEVIVGLQVDTSKASMSELLDSAELASFIPNTMLKNAELLNNSLYRIEKAWNRGDKSPNGKKAKGYGYKIFKLGVDAQSKQEFQTRYNELKMPETELSEVSSKPEL